MTEAADKSAVAVAGECSMCGAALQPNANRCWLCGAEVRGTGQGESMGASLPRPIPGGVDLPAGGFSLAALMMFVTLVSVVLGVSTIAPGVGIPLGMILLVVWLRTAAVARRRRLRGMLVTRADILDTFFGSLGVAVVLIILTGLAGCAAFFAACYSCAAAWSVGGQGLGTVVFVLVAAAIAIPTLVWMGKLIYRRWRRDIGEPN